MIRWFCLFAGKIRVFAILRLRTEFLGFTHDLFILSAPRDTWSRKFSEQKLIKSILSTEILAGSPLKYVPIEPPEVNHHQNKTLQREKSGQHQKKKKNKKPSIFLLFRRWAGDPLIAPLNPSLPQKFNKTKIVHTKNPKIFPEKHEQCWRPVIS